jgi:cinnamyl-alcohol dehydrogenase
LTLLLATIYLIPISHSFKVDGVMAVVCFPSKIKMHPANLNLGNSLIIHSYSLCIIYLLFHCINKWQETLLHLAGTYFPGARTLVGSITGGTKDIQEMINFCGAKRIYPETEIIEMDYINEALKRIVNRYVKYHFVIDIENSFK